MDLCTILYCGGKFTRVASEVNKLEYTFIHTVDMDSRRLLLRRSYGIIGSTKNKLDPRGRFQEMS